MVRGYDGTPLWICFCRFVFAVSALAFIVSFFGPAVLGADLIGFLAYQEWILTHASFLYMVVIVVTFTLAVISGFLTIIYEKKMAKSNEKETEL